MCLLLLKHGADPSIKEKKGLTPGQLVTSTRCKAVRSLSAEVKQTLGVDEWSGAYADPALDPENIKFWGKLGPPPRMTQADRDQYRAEKEARKAKKV